MQSSFLGRSSGTASALLAKSSSNFGNAKSFIFGSENRSSQGATANESQPQVSLLRSQHNSHSGLKITCAFQKESQQKGCLSISRSNCKHVTSTAARGWQHIPVC